MKRIIEGKSKIIDGAISRFCPQTIPQPIRGDIEESQFERPIVLCKGDIIIASKIIEGADQGIPEALQAAGVACIISSAFPRTFYRNCINLGIPLIESSEAIGKIADREVISVDFEKGEILCKKGIVPFQLFPEIISKILYSGGLIPNVKRALGK